MNTEQIAEISWEQAWPRVSRGQLAGPLGLHLITATANVSLVLFHNKLMLRHLVHFKHLYICSIPS